MINEKAMIVKLSISQWTARKYDRGITQNVESIYNAEGSGRWNKMLIADTILKKIASIANEARTYHYNATLPWGPDTWILPVEMYPTYDAKMKGYMSSFNEIVEDEFIPAYPNLVEDARARLNGMYRDDDYPHSGVIRNKFKFVVAYYPIPAAGDFRVNLAEEEVQSIRQKISDEMEKLQQEANQHLWNRLYDAVSHMSERLMEKNLVFRNSLVGNVREVCDMLKYLNITGDVELEEMRQRVEEQLTISEPDELRKSPLMREATAKDASKLLADIETYGKRRIRL